MKRTTDSVITKTERVEMDIEEVEKILCMAEGMDNGRVTWDCSCDEPARVFITKVTESKGEDE